MHRIKGSHPLPGTVINEKGEYQKVRDVYGQDYDDLGSNSGSRTPK